MRNLSHFSTLLLLIVMATGPIIARGQYYYKDIISTSQINSTFRAYAASKVKGVTLNTFNGNIPITEGFKCEQKASYRPNKVVTYTKTSDNGESFLTTHYNSDGLLIKSVDSNSLSVSTSTYQYNNSNQLVELKNQSRARDNSSSVLEIHSWNYDAAGKPVQMLRIVNAKDTTVVKFTLDEKGNPAEEESFRKNISQGKIYYYHDENNYLTDVVRYNEKAQKLLPDYIFDYEHNGELSSMTIFPVAGAKIQRWFYQYDDKGLKLADFCYDKGETLQGKVEYTYTY